MGRDPFHCSIISLFKLTDRTGLRRGEPLQGYQRRSDAARIEQSSNLESVSTVDRRRRAGPDSRHDGPLTARTVQHSRQPLLGIIPHESTSITKAEGWSESSTPSFMDGSTIQIEPELNGSLDSKETYTSIASLNVDKERKVNQRLSRDQRRDILLMRRLGHKYEDIARFLDVTQAAVQYTVNTGRASPEHYNAGRKKTARSGVGK